MADIGFEEYTGPVTRPQPTSSYGLGQGQEVPFPEYVPGASQSSPTKPTSLSFDEVAADEERMAKIRRMMSLTKDRKYEEIPSEEVLNDFMSHMRWVSTNEVSTFKEARDVALADDDLRAAYGDAYGVYDEMGSIFTNGDAWNGTLDYAGSFLSSPSLYLGWGVGKLVGTGSSKAAATGIRAAVQSAVKETAKKGASEAVQQAVAQQVKTAAVTQSAKKMLLSTVAVDVPMNLLQDYLYQDTRMKTGVQDEYSLLQTTVAGLAAGFTAIPTVGSYYWKKGSVLGQTGELLDNATKVRRANAAKKAAPEIAEALGKAQADWLRMAQNGIDLEANRALRDGVTDWFLNINREDSFIRILQRAGADLDLTGEGKFVRSMMDFAMSIEGDALAGINRSLEPMGLTFGETTEILAAAVQEAGQRGSAASIASRFYREFQNVSVAKRSARKTLVESAEEGAEDAAEEGDKHLFRYIQSTWKKSIVATLPTTAVNVLGYGYARMARSVADIAHATALYGKAGAQAVFSPGEFAKTAARANHLMKNQAFLLNSLVDPFMSSDAFFELLSRAPTKIQKQAVRTVYGGVDDFSPQHFGLNPKSLGVRAVETYTDFAQTVSLLRMQDTLTKGLTGITELDKLTRLEFGESIVDMIQKGRTHMITDEMWEKTLKSVLQDTFSEDLTKGAGIHQIAKAVEVVSNAPGFGFVMPFGRFMNNTMAFLYRYSPMGLMSVFAKVSKRGRTLPEIYTQAAVGSAALGALAFHEGSKKEDGLQWYEERTDTGDVVNVGTLFPYSVYALMGRMAHNVVETGRMDMDLLNELRKQVGPLEAFEAISAPPALRDLATFLTDDNVAQQEKLEVFSVVGYFLESVGHVAAGYTRPLQVPMRATMEGFNLDTADDIKADRDRSEGLEGALIGITRYTNAVFDALLGEETEYGTKMVGKPRESASTFGPVREPPLAGYMLGTTYQQPKTKFTRLLALVDKAPYTVDLRNSGIPEYDAFINKTVTPLLEERAEKLLNNAHFKDAIPSLKRKMVDDMISSVRIDVARALEGGYIGDEGNRLDNERRKLLSRDRHSIQRAKEALGIDRRNHELTLLDIQSIKIYIETEKEQVDRLVK